MDQPTDQSTATLPGATNDDTAPPPCAATADASVAAVIDWFQSAGRDLPWRHRGVSPWAILVSEVMLQQTPVVRVLPRWLAWQERWPTPQALADAPVADVLRAWDRLGYPRRALRLRECAIEVTARYDGQLPADDAQLRSLPGIGEYTAAAVMAFGFGQRSVVLDTNVRRVIARFLGGTAGPPPHLTAGERAAAAAIVPAEPAQAARWAAASMELGALICTARRPLCDECPIARTCRWRAAGYPAAAPNATRRTQAWHGTDRQVRGKVMALLRSRPELTWAEIRAEVTAPDAQLERSVAGLVSDGLAVSDDAGWYRLP